MDASHGVQVTHPFHPLFGQTFPRAGDRRSRHGDYLWLGAADGSTFSLPKHWTSESPVDAFHQIAKGRCSFRPEDLLELAGIVAALKSGAHTASVQTDV